MTAASVTDCRTICRLFWMWSSVSAMKIGTVPNGSRMAKRRRKASVNSVRSNVRKAERSTILLFLPANPSAERINRLLGENHSMTSEAVSLSEIQAQLSKIIDPEIGRPITDMNLVDRLDIRDGFVDVEFHLTAAFCPPMFALKIASDIKSSVLSVKGVREVKVTLRGHYLADAVNKQVNKPPPTVTS